MKITREQFEAALYAATQQNGVSSGVHWPRFEAVTHATLAALGVEVVEPDVTIWVPRTWVDVREGDIIRPPQPTGRPLADPERHAAIVVKIGPVTPWHAAPDASQYRPNESPMEWSAMRVTLSPLADPNAPLFTPEHGMRPDAGVEIKVTRVELAAIEAMGGWTERMGVCES